MSITSALELALTLAAMLSATVIRRSSLVREIRYLRSSQPGQKKEKRKGDGSGDGWLGGAGWPDSDHDSDSGGGTGDSD